MSTMLEYDAAPSARITRPLTPLAEPLASPSSPRGPTRRRLPWWHLALRAIKGLFLTAELCAILVLATYAGLLRVLPPNPPALHVLAPGHEVVARQNAYCWFTPGRGLCADSSTSGTLSPAPPLVTVPRGASLRLTVAYPAPTQCVATTDSTSAPGKPVTQALSSSSSSSSQSLSSITYHFGVTLRPGTYHVTIACQWVPLRTMRWLQGLGDSSYDIALRVVAH
jgi:hypothetical protein